MIAETNQYIITRSLYPLRVLGLPTISGTYRLNRYIKGMHKAMLAAVTATAMPVSVQGETANAWEIHTAARGLK